LRSIAKFLKCDFNLNATIIKLTIWCCLLRAAIELVLEVLVPKGTAPTWSNNGIAIFLIICLIFFNLKTFCSRATGTSDRNGWWVETELNQEVRSRALSVAVHAQPSPSLASHVIAPPPQYLFNGKLLSNSRVY